METKSSGEWIWEVRLWPETTVVVNCIEGRCVFGVCYIIARAWSVWVELMCVKNESRSCLPIVRYLPPRWGVFARVVKVIQWRVDRAWHLTNSKPQTRTHCNETDKATWRIAAKRSTEIEVHLHHWCCKYVVVAWWAPLIPCFCDCQRPGIYIYSLIAWCP